MFKTIFQKSVLKVNIFNLLTQRSRLKDYVEDANWRLSMVADTGTDDLGSGGSSSTAVSDEQWVYNDSSDSDNPSLPPSSPTRKKKKIKRQESSKSESSSGENSIYADDATVVLV